MRRAGELPQCVVRDRRSASPGRLSPSLSRWITGTGSALVETLVAAAVDQEAVDDAGARVAFVDVAIQPAAPTATVRRRCTRSTRQRAERGRCRPAYAPPARSARTCRSDQSSPGWSSGGVAHRVPDLRRQSRDAAHARGLRADVDEGVALAQQELVRLELSTAFSNCAVTLTQSSSTVPLKSCASRGRVDDDARGVRRLGAVGLHAARPRRRNIPLRRSRARPGRTSCPTAGGHAGRR